MGSTSILTYFPLSNTMCNDSEVINQNYVDICNNLTGQTGIQGVTGFQGVTGPSAGPQGFTGIPGSTGPQGSTGLRGPTGVQGDTGVQGNTGVAGATGVQGVQGDTGVQGRTGVQGNTGVQGHTGLANFIDSSSCPQMFEVQTLMWSQGKEALYAGITGIGHWCQISAGSTQGATGYGIQGATGLRGPTGIQGVTGLQGRTGIQGQTGLGALGYAATYAYTTSGTGATIDFTSDVEQILPMTLELTTGSPADFEIVGGNSLQINTAGVYQITWAINALAIGMEGYSTTGKMYILHPGTGLKVHETICWVGTHDAYRVMTNTSVVSIPSTSGYKIKLSMHTLVADLVVTVENSNISIVRVG